jgi:hypothetical protein
MGGVGDFLFGSKPKQKSSSTSESGNHAWNFLSQALAPSVGGLQSGMGMLGSMLGLNNFGGGMPSVGMPTNPTPPTAQEPEYSGGSKIKQGMRGARYAAQHAAPNPIPEMGAPELPVYNPQTQQDALEAFSNATGMDFLRSQGIKAIEGSQAGRGMLNSGATGQALMQFGQNLGKTHVMSFMDKLLDYSRLGLGAAGTMAGAGAWSKGSSTSKGDGGKTGLIPLAVSQFIRHSTEAQHR